ncbi:bacillithiol system redox-active protein YtxJ [Flavobacterium sp. SM15]|uniref:bacillithiol system redox-active protein YtxJ n=1 Tax=Flavobacterium sp. SM15 TaxID=2908005 RepID=UPI001EDBF796|nr:bacillithiol system redox-active protein YtxJ [Flavobacterium sp. SM15]MCG2612068.1 bacillithiol system redox-active protein YtxJ [Flavobacterium sp. SM15]
MSFFKNLFGESENEKPVSKMNWEPLTELNQLEEIVKQSIEKPILIFKHSTRCSISRMALKQFENSFEFQDKITPYFLDLLEYRPVSNEIASLFEVVHQSPQLIVVKGGKAVYDASHSDIDAEDLKKYF